MVVSDTGQVMSDLNTETLNLLNNIEQVALNSKKMAGNGQRVERAIYEIAAVSEEFADSTQKVAAQNNEQLGATKKIATNAQMLATIARELEETVNIFKI